MKEIKIEVDIGNKQNYNKTNMFNFWEISDFLIFGKKTGLKRISRNFMIYLYNNTENNYIFENVIFCSILLSYNIPDFI